MSSEIVLEFHRGRLPSFTFGGYGEPIPIESGWVVLGVHGGGGFLRGAEWTRVVGEQPERALVLVGPDNVRCRFDLDRMRVGEFVVVEDSDAFTFRRLGGCW